MKKLQVLILLFLLAGGKLNAEQVEFTASAKTTVSVGEQFRVTFSVNAQGTGFRAPAFRDFSVLSGPNQSSSTSVQFINGSMSQTVSYSYTYILSASREGTFNLPPASITVGGKTYQSNALKINVVKGSYSTQNQPYSQGRNRYGQQDPQAATPGGKDVFLRASVNKNNPLQGEQIIVTYRIYTKVPVSQYVINKLSSYSGFWSKDLMKENEKLEQHNEVVDGVKYVVAEIRKVALFPQKSGKLTIDPLEIECVAQIRSRARNSDPFFDSFFSDPFFNSGYQNVKKVLKSDAVTINVRPLPSAGKPIDFNGAVGKFSFRSDLDKNKVKANEAINLKFTVSGEGNIDLIEKPPVIFPPDFESYDPKISSNFSTSNMVVSGSKTFEYLLIPRNPGKYTIKPVTFSYFDIGKQAYSSVTSPEYTIEVEKGSGSQANVAYSTANQEDIKYIGSDIRFIKNGGLQLRPLGYFFFGSLRYWLLMLLPAVLFALLILLWKRQLKRRSDILMMKNRKATKVARKRLRTAQSLLGSSNKEAFYNEISQALWGYLSDKFAIPRAELSMDSVSDALAGKSVSQDIIDAFIQTLNNCEFARFAPVDPTAEMESIYNQAIGIITRIERELK